MLYERKVFLGPCLLNWILETDSKKITFRQRDQCRQRQWCLREFYVCENANSFHIMLLTYWTTAFSVPQCIISSLTFGHSYAITSLLLFPFPPFTIAQLLLIHSYLTFKTKLHHTAKIALNPFYCNFFGCRVYVLFFRVLQKPEFSLIYLQNLAQCLSYRRYSAMICWMNLSMGVVAQ